MEITITVECRTGWGETTTAKVLRLKRPVSGLSIADVGLTLQEGKRLLHAVQREFVRKQLDEYSIFRGVCPSCLRPRSRKDRRSRKLHTVFGTVEVEGPRWLTCECEHWIRWNFAPITQVLTERFTPELLYLQANLAARMPFRKAARIIDQFLPRVTRTSHETIRRRTHLVAKLLENRQSEIAEPSFSEQLGVAYIGLDGAHVRARPGFNRRNHEIIVGRLLTDNKPGKIFTAIRIADQSAHARLRAALYEAGIGSQTAITVFSDGDDTLARLVEEALGKPVTRILDWFHIVMRLQTIAKVIGDIPNVEPAEQAAISEAMRCLRHLRWRIWHAHSDRFVDGAEAVMNALVPIERSSARATARCGSARYLLGELVDYLKSNREALVNYGVRYRAKERISTGFVESTINSIVNHRMGKKRQMRWTANGAHRLLQVRVALANRELRTHFRALHPRFQAADDADGTKVPQV